MRSGFGHYANAAAKYDDSDEPYRKLCPICKEKKTEDILTGELFLVEKRVFQTRRFKKGYHKVCKECFISYLLKFPDVKIYSGNPEPWLDRHLVLSETVIEGIGWIAHDRAAILKQFKL